MESVIANTQVGILFQMLDESHLDMVLANRLNPEISFGVTGMSDYEESRYKQIGKALLDNRAKVSLHGPFMDLSPGSPDPDIWRVTQKRFERILELLPYFRPGCVTCHISYEEGRYGPLRETWEKQSLAMWEWLGKALNKEGVPLMLENVYEQTPEEVLFIFEALSHLDIGFCLDVGHVNVWSPLPLEKWIHTMGRHIRQFHLHDNFGKKDDHRGFGAGRIDFTPVWEYLEAAEELPVVTMEIHTESEVFPGFAYLKKHCPRLAEKNFTTS